MSRLEEIRKRRKAKQRKTNLIAIFVLVGIILIVSLALALVGNKNKDKKVTEDKKQTDAAKQEQGSGEDKEKEAEKKMTPEEKAAIEKKRKEEYGEFYVPLPEVEVKAENKKVRGLYVTATTASYDFSEENIKKYEKYINSLKGSGDQAPDVSDVNNLEKILAICNATDINALVIDIKSDDGNITWSSDIDAVKTLGTEMPASKDNYKALLQYMKEHDIYPMARVVVFKDYIVPDKLPEHAMQLKAGGIYRDNQGMPWVNQFDNYIWKYVVAVSKEAALRGFKEIHFDYIRFPDNAAYYNEIVDFPGRDGKKKDQNIKDFIEFAQKELQPYGVNVGAAVFGIITKSWEDYPENIGQTWVKITDAVNVISPMIYPSHYSTGWYGFDYPDAHPYGVFNQALKEALLKNSAVKDPAKIRPWIQAFTAPWVDGYIEYTPEVVKEQIKAGIELGIDEYLVWNAVNEYEPLAYVGAEAFKQNSNLNPSELPDYTAENMNKERETDSKTVVDSLGNSPFDAVLKYFYGVKDSIIEDMFLYTTRDSRKATVEEFEQDFKSKSYSLPEFKVESVSKNEKGYDFKLSGTLTSGEKTTDLSTLNVNVVLEDGIFKVVAPNFN